MVQLREFLRHQYIGAIVIGLLAYQGLVYLFATVSGSVIFFVASHGNQSVFGYDKPAIPWDRFLPNFIQGLLALSLAYVMLRWLYGAKPGTPVEGAQTEPAE
jgi:hypothetical protein